MDDKINVEKRSLDYTYFMRTDDGFINSLSEDEFAEYVCVLNECSDYYLGETNHE